MNKTIRKEPARKVLDEKTIRELWSKTYNTQGKPDWSHIFPYYSENIIFQDSIQRVEGIEEFKELCKRLTQRSKKLSMEIGTVSITGSSIFFDWTMMISFKDNPHTPVYGCTKLTINENNQIVHQRDYYDLWGDIFNGIPFFKKPYRRFMRKRFG